MQTSILAQPRSRVSDEARRNVCITESFSISQFLEMPLQCDQNCCPHLRQLQCASCFISSLALAWFPQMVFRLPCTQPSWVLTLGLSQQWMLSTYSVPGTVLDSRDTTRNKRDIALFVPSTLHHQSLRAFTADNR